MPCMLDTRAAYELASLLPHQTCAYTHSHPHAGFVAVSQQSAQRSKSWCKVCVCNSAFRHQLSTNEVLSSNAKQDEHCSTNLPMASSPGVQHRRPAIRLSGKQPEVRAAVSIGHHCQCHEQTKHGVHNKIHIPRAECNMGVVRMLTPTEGLGTQCKAMIIHNITCRGFAPASEVCCELHWVSADVKSLTAHDDKRPSGSTTTNIERGCTVRSELAEQFELELAAAALAFLRT